MKKLFVLFFSLLALFNISNAQNKNAGYLDLSIGKTQLHDISISVKGIYSHPYNEYFSLGLGAGLMGTYHTLIDFSYINEQQYATISDDLAKDISLEIPVFVNFRGNVAIGNSKIVPYYSLNVGYLIKLKSASTEFAFRQTDHNNYTVYEINEFEDGLFLTPEIGISYKKIHIGVEYMFGINNYYEIRTDHYFGDGVLEASDFHSFNTSIGIVSFKIVSRL